MKFFSSDCDCALINGKTLITPGFYDSEHSHICSVCLMFGVSSLIEIQWLQIEPSEKGTHTSECMML